jgi:hypothetical protein
MFKKMLMCTLAKKGIQDHTEKDKLTIKQLLKIKTDRNIQVRHKKNFK